MRDDEVRPLTSGTTSGNNDGRGMRSRESTVEPPIALTSNNAVATTPSEAATNEVGLQNNPAATIATAPLLPTVLEEERDATAVALNATAIDGEGNTAEAAAVVVRNPRDIVPDPAVSGEFHASTKYYRTHRFLDGCDDGPVEPDAFELLLNIRTMYPRHIPDYMKPGAPAANLGVQMIAEQPAATATHSDELEDALMHESSDSVVDMDISWTTGGPFDNASVEQVLAPIATQNSAAQMQTPISKCSCHDRGMASLTTTQMSSTDPTPVARRPLILPPTTPPATGMLRWSRPLRRHF